MLIDQFEAKACTDEARHCHKAKINGKQKFSGSDRTSRVQERPAGDSVTGLPAGIIEGEALVELRRLPDSFVDLIVTSPPYADSRKRTYGGIHPDQYVDWFAPISLELRRVLKPTGSLVLNIKEKVVEGERHTYVLDLIQRLRQQGWLWTEEYTWHKKNCYPGKWPNRFRDAWERCLHFTKSRKLQLN